MTTNPSSSTQSPSSSRGSSYRSRGRGRGRGSYSGQPRRGTGRGERGEESSNPGGQHNSRGNATQPRAPLTHFLALPLGHHPGLRTRVANFTNSLLESNPPIPGLDQSVIISPRRLHLTLGVMSLSHESTGTSAGKTLQDAAALLTQLKPEILARLEGNPLRVALNHVDIMRPERGDLEKAHVMWVGPAPGDEDTRRLKGVSEYLHREFIKAGLMVDEKRPLKLHCTVINTTYRKPRPRQRTPFSYASILEAPALKAIETHSGDRSGTTDTPAGSTRGNEKPRGKSPISIDLGTWDIDEIQICEMGSWGPEGEYVCVAQCPLS